MLCVDELNRIQLTRGDNADLGIRLLNIPGFEEVAIDSEDVINFRVFDIRTKEIVIDKNNDACLDAIFIYPEDTKDLETGLYIYDVTLTNRYDEVNTIIPAGWFRLRGDI